MPETPAGIGIQDVFAHHGWIVEQPQETSLGNAADHGPTHWHAVEPVCCCRMRSVTIRDQRQQYVDITKRWHG
jgi:hypothetical protein